LNTYLSDALLSYSLYYLSSKHESEATRRIDESSSPVFNPPSYKEENSLTLRSSLIKWTEEVKYICNTAVVSECVNSLNLIITIISMNCIVYKSKCDEKELVKVYFLYSTQTLLLMALIENYNEKRSTFDSVN
jgi:hypothetical protein